MLKNILIGVLSIVCLFIFFRQENKNYYDMVNAVSGATPLAVAKDVPGHVALTVDGLVKQTYQFSGSALNGFASTRIRTIEYQADGTFTGAYIYVGIPVFHIMEGIAPQKPETANFKQPLDILVTFTSAAGKSVDFSFNEIIMTDDDHPITLAYYREPVQPTNEKARETYRKNKNTQPLAGLRLIAPKEPDTTRYLDDVIRITYRVLSFPEKLLPERKKGMRCTSQAIACIDQDQLRPAIFTGVERRRIQRWPMIGHGHGYERTVEVDGYDLQSFLRTNFAEVQASDLFLFVACDGYRALFTGRELFATQDGDRALIADRIDGHMPAKGFRLAPTADYFADRSMWALAYVVRTRGDVDEERLLSSSK